MQMTHAAAWWILLVAGLLEIAWAMTMKASEGFSKWHFTAVTIAAAWASFVLLGLSLKALPVGTAYAAWTGIGAVGTAALGMLIFHEPATFARLGFIALIVAGIVGLKVTSSH
jgi:quaternary ammonium compound-resistance protein SugE